MLFICPTRIRSRSHPCCDCTAHDPTGRAWSDDTRQQIQSKPSLTDKANGDDLVNCSWFLVLSGSYSSPISNLNSLVEPELFWGRWGLKFRFWIVFEVFNAALQIVVKRFSCLLNWILFVANQVSILLRFEVLLLFLSISLRIASQHGVVEAGGLSENAIC